MALLKEINDQMFSNSADINHSAWKYIVLLFSSRLHWISPWYWPPLTGIYWDTLTHKLLYPAQGTHKKIRTNDKEAWTILRRLKHCCQKSNTMNIIRHSDLIFFLSFRYILLYCSCIELYVWSMGIYLWYISLKNQLPKSWPSCSMF